MTNIRDTHASRGLSIRSLHLFMAFATLFISVLLLVATFMVKSGYSKMRTDTESYIRWEKDADDLQRGSDYLTEQVRCFVETGKRVYLDNYFEEATITNRRENALQSIHDYLGDGPAYTSLKTAMDESIALMDREYYAMRLTVAAFGYDFRDFPEAIQRVELSEEDALLPAEKQARLARDKVFDDVYRTRKDTISENVQACLQMLTAEIDQRQERQADALDDMLFKQRILIINAIVIILSTMGATLLLVVSPLVRAVVFIRSDEPIPIKGSNEFQFLAKTYNLMYETHREQTEKLAYDATHDKLTGLYNRSGYDFVMKNTDWGTSCLLLFDVDKFKHINDSRGHEAGDRLLTRVANAIKESFRSQDYVCRIGGDEFAVIMVHTSPEHAELVRRKAASINETLAVSVDDLPPTLVSCGVAFGDETSNSTGIFQKADAALYDVKNTGGCGCKISGQ